MSVSRETLERLDAFERLALKWNSKINLFAKSTEAELRSRHIEDSLQVFDLAPKFSHWVDLGTGGGFPGVIVAICALEYRSASKFTFVEADQRKSVFLREVVRRLDLKADVVTGRIEELPPLNADVISARALAPLEKLCEYTLKHRREDGISLFPKGDSFENEIATAKKRWCFDPKIHPSHTRNGAVILELGAISHG